VGGLILFLWALMFAMFFSGFRFLRGTMAMASGLLIDHMFSFLFLMLLVLMTVSNAIICYISLFRSEETTFLFSLPIHARTTFAYRASGSVVFSLWGMFTIVFPMVIAYGLVFPVRWHYYVYAIGLSALFTGLTTELGALFGLLAGIVLPRRRKTAVVWAAALGVVLVATQVIPLIRRLLRPEPTELGLRMIIDRISFSGHWALPSRWVSRGMLLAAEGYPRRAGALTLHLLANVLFVPIVNQRLALGAYRRTWEAVQGTGSRRRYGRAGPVETVLRALVFFVPGRLRQLILKDLKTFLRDPSQWSQFVLFFGLLGLYILNLRAGRAYMMRARWHSLVTAVNLGAICLTLATLTSRFVYPQLSLEGRRIWITGLLPMSRAMIIWGKFLFAVVGTFLGSAGLMVLSDVMLRLPVWMMGVHVLVVLCVCCGLNGLAVGLGALYPQMDSDNPAKIVSSFGGTLNLICSICFITVTLVPVVVVLNAHMVGRWTGGWFGVGLAAALVFMTAASLVTCALPMVAGARAFSRMEF